MRADLPSPSVTRREFGAMPDGRTVHEYTLDNGRGLLLTAINYGGVVTAIHCPDRDGRHAAVGAPERCARG